MISGIDLNATVDYVLKDDKENPTIWKLGALTSSAMLELSSTSEGKDYMKQMIKLVRLGLRGWENFKLNGEDIKFESKEGLIPKPLVDMIPINVVIELSTELIKINKLSSKEIKN